ncbi:MAG: fumarate reductase subunit C [Halomonas sp.]|uniref:fumarate reductase subunit C n=1 Tax=Halomonas sp. TaxID=1486246 RepID=UPI002ACD8131|nr:fumarate reductase subunit C [Halomonas sp.]MDZ7851551.1 fumarate reductase subunit C [Halomonas sp.]
MAKQTSYFPELKRDWWLKHPYFKKYMLREATVLPLVFFLVCLLAGLVSLLQGAESWQGWLKFMQNPLVIALNFLAFIASLFHAWTFFQLFPRVMPLRAAGRTLPPNLMVLGQWLGVVAVMLLAAWIFMRRL